MMQQTFDTVAADVALREALARVELHAPSEIKTSLLEAILRAALELPALTTDDVWSRFRLGRYWIGSPPEPRVLGAMMRTAVKAAWIVTTPNFILSNRVACHRRPVRVWRSLLCRRGERE
jgi:hypothetical protein